MNDIFFNVLNLSITASWIVLVVVLLRFALKKAPKWINCILWAVVGIRLAVPVSFESILSLIPSAKTINIPGYTGIPYIDTGVSPVDNTVNEFIYTYYYPALEQGIYFPDIMDIISIVWIAGVFVMIAYSVISYIRLYRNVRVSVHSTDNIYYCDYINSPFILGIVKPKIYLPSGMDAQQAEYVISHEKAHLKRKDHWWKPLGFLLLSVYWFNPVMWIAYVLLCRDIELACDEKVIKDMDNADRKSYSHALISCSVQRRMIMACPLAFGEVGVKDRIKSVLNYKKPAFWVIVVAVVICIVVSVCFLTNPVEEYLIYRIKDGYTTHENVDVNITKLSVGDSESYLVMEWQNNSGKTISYGSEFHLYRKVFGSAPVEIKGGNNVWNSLAYIVSDVVDERTFNLSSYNLSEKGEYVLEFKFYIEGEDAIYKAYLEFNANDEYDVDSDIIDGADGPENVTVDAIEALKQKYPKYFGLSTKDGLVVYVWQFSKGNYSCGLLSGTVTEQSNKNGWNAVSTSVEEMHIILSTYDIDPSRVSVIPYANPASSYYYKIDDAYIKSVKALFPGYGILTEPPQLKISDGNNVNGWIGTYSWIYSNGDGTSVATNADSSHPLEYVDSMTPLDVKNISTIPLEFTVKPDKITVNRYDISKGISAKGKKIETDGMTFEASKGEYLYEIVAEWNSYENYSGTVHYAFWTK